MNPRTLIVRKRLFFILVITLGLVVGGGVFSLAFSPDSETPPCVTRLDPIPPGEDASPILEQRCFSDWGEYKGWLMESGYDVPDDVNGPAVADWVGENPSAAQTNDQ